MPAYEIPETTRTAKGQPIINLLGLQKNEEISAHSESCICGNQHLVSDEGWLLLRHGICWSIFRYLRIGLYLRQVYRQ